MVGPFFMPVSKKCRKVPSEISPEWVDRIVPAEVIDPVLGVGNQTCPVDSAMCLRSGTLVLVSRPRPTHRDRFVR